MPAKRLIVGCDGTWLSSDNGLERDSWLPWSSRGTLQLPSNITRISRALVPKSKDGVNQITYYQSGLGSEDNWWSFYIGGYLGHGISENIREAYTFLANNYEDGDEIFLLGFSRGAFTARSIAGLVSSIGLLTKKGMPAFYPIFKDWQNQNNPNNKDRWPIDGWDVKPMEGEKSEITRPPLNDPSYTTHLKDLGLSRLNIPIKAVAVWDTVGSLGVPQIGPFVSHSRKEYAFINTEVAPNIEYAYQALALDEHRRPFSPTIWESPSTGTSAVLKELKQCWFPGVHSNVGGSYPDQGIADITLEWIISQLSPHLEFDGSYVPEQQKLTARFYTEQKKDARPWGFGRIYSSDSALEYVTGREVRTPGTYTRMDPSTGARTKMRLQNTREFIHPCVRLRKGRGLGTDDTPNYQPGALAGWTLYEPNQTYESGKNPWPIAHDGFWKWVTGIKGSGELVYIVEDVPKHAEMQTIYWPEAKEIVQYKVSEKVRTMANACDM